MVRSGLQDHMLAYGVAMIYDCSHYTGDLPCSHDIGQPGPHLVLHATHAAQALSQTYNELDLNTDLYTNAHTFVNTLKDRQQWARPGIRTRSSQSNSAGKWRVMNHVTTHPEAWSALPRPQRPCSTADNERNVQAPSYQCHGYCTASSGLC
jgi:hypothetical protein